jgi:hypothetical protein
MWKYSRTDNIDPSLATPYKLKELPTRARVRTESEEPRAA